MDAMKTEREGIAGTMKGKSGCLLSWSESGETETLQSVFGVLCVAGTHGSIETYLARGSPWDRNVLHRCTRI